MLVDGFVLSIGVISLKYIKDYAMSSVGQRELNVQTMQQAQLLAKCSGWTEAREVQKLGLYPYFKPISKAEDTVVVIEGRERVMMGSNNYLSLTHHPKVLEAARRALETFGSGCTGSRFLNGTLALHEELEGRLAEHFGKESVLVFSTGYQANLGLVQGLIGRGDVVLVDKLDHASIIDGAKLSYGETTRFNHGDLRHLELKLQKYSNRSMMIIVDGVYSMEGDIADVPQLLDLAQRYGAVLAVDDAHSVGVLGPNGDGTAAHFGLAEEVDIVVGTFSKSLASIGGFVGASESVIHYLKHHSRPLIFTASLPPSNTAGVLAALDVMINEPERREMLWRNTRRFQQGCRSLGFDIGPTETPIVPVLIGTLQNTFAFWRALFDAGVFTNPVVPPAVPPDQCRLRASLMATHTEEQIDSALEIFGSLGKKMGVI
jgi:8-amino-7-oxononanoate synthase